jgi:mono/diheme cytochrome c family protein
MKHAICAAIAIMAAVTAVSVSAQPQPDRQKEPPVDYWQTQWMQRELWGPVMQIVDAEDVGDARRGAYYAQKSCSSCHNVSASDAASPNRQAPGFKKIANTPGMTVTALTVWSRTSHPSMPNFVIDPKDMDDLIAYILSLKDRR